MLKHKISQFVSNILMDFMDKTSWKIMKVQADKIERLEKANQDLLEERQMKNNIIEKMSYVIENKP